MQVISTQLSGYPEWLWPHPQSDPVSTPDGAQSSGFQSLGETISLPLRARTVPLVPSAAPVGKDCTRRPSTSSLIFFIRHLHVKRGMGIARDAAARPVKIARPTGLPPDSRSDHAPPVSDAPRKGQYFPSPPRDPALSSSGSRCNRSCSQGDDDATDEAGSDPGGVVRDHAASREERDRGRVRIGPALP